ncbi:murein biosynthesis integral membrane protein MurJ [Peribacillus simplex]|uniref:murein biosynthesis integral membrane protein MurJ n=1 Tax=Peribacillus simplex TaxID=1478 RepID=UPI002989C0BF|nr:murein biosynthesis integral membrane protein MurJ [Peribacillus simplex]MBX9954124.1 murein biosynthesis integral membrane protein MurJ [Peribacillus simplex]
MKKIALMLMLVTILTKVFGLIRDIALSFYYGASNISDAYLIATTLPGIIFAFIGAGIATSFIPIFTKIIKEEDEHSAEKFTNNVVNFVMLLCTFICLIAFLFTDLIVKILASGFEGETLKIAVTFTRITIFSIYFSGLLFIFKGYLEVKNNFIIPALVGIPLNIIVILSIALSAKINPIILPVGTIVAGVFQLVLVLPYVYKNGYRHSFIFNKNNKHFKNMVYLTLPVIIGASVNEINLLVDRTLASQIETGAISALTYASRLNAFVQGIFVTSIATVMYPMISRMASGDNLNGLKNTISQAITGICVLVMPATVFSMTFSEQIVEFLFGRGEFDSQAIEMTSKALFFFSIGMLAIGIREVISRVFYALQDTKTPMINASIAMILNIILNIILSKYLGVGGLALATSISAIICSMLLLFSLIKKIGFIGIKEMLNSFIKLLILSILVGVFSRFLYDLLINKLGTSLSLLLTILIGGVIYCSILLLLKIEVINSIIINIKKKIRS